jgi:hypothetical protein
LLRITSIHWSVKISIWLRFSLFFSLFFLLSIINFLQNSIFILISKYLVNCSSFFGVSKNDFIDKKLLNDFLINGVLFELKVKESYWWTNFKIIGLRVVKLLEKWMLENL